MSEAENKALARRWFEGAYNEGNLALADEVFAPGFTLHGQPGGGGVGPEGPKRNVAAYRAAFPDLRATVEDQVAERDRVVTRWTARGAHRGEFFGVPATGRAVAIPVVVVWRVEAGRAAEDWTLWDRLGVLQQLGAAPAPPSGG